MYHLLKVRELKGGLKYAVSFDDEAPQIINMNEGSEKGYVWNPLGF